MKWLIINQTCKQISIGNMDIHLGQMAFSHQKKLNLGGKKTLIPTVLTCVLLILLVVCIICMKRYRVGPFKRKIIHHAPTVAYFPDNPVQQVSHRLMPDTDPESSTSTKLNGNRRERERERESRKLSCPYFVGIILKSTIMEPQFRSTWLVYWLSLSNTLWDTKQYAITFIDIDCNNCWSLMTVLVFSK